MTAEKSIKILKAVKELKDDAIYTLTDLTEAYRMAIEALSKQCASTGQADQCGNNTEMVDQFRDSTKMTEDVPDIHVGKTDFQPGNKFILELGQERRMFGEFEIAGTDLYVETRLLEKLTRYDPEVKLDSAQPEIIYCKDCKYAEGVLGAIWCDKDGGYYNPMRHFCSEAERRNDERMGNS